MSLKRPLEQSEGDSSFNNNKELLNQLTDYELLNVYNTLYHTTYGEDYLNYIYTQVHISNWRQSCIDMIIRELQTRYIQNHPPQLLQHAPPTINEQLPTNIQQVKLNKLSENDKLKLRVQELERENQMLRNYIQTMNAKLIPQKYNENQETKHNKTNTSKFIVEGIPKRIPKHPAIDEIKEVQSNIPTPPEQLNKPTPYGESEQFTKQHCNMNGVN